MTSGAEDAASEPAAPLRAAAAVATFAEELLASPTSQNTCRLLAEEVVRRAGCYWSAVFHLASEDAVFDVTAAVGPVPAPLHEAHNMTPRELALLAGWDENGPQAQICNLEAGHPWQRAVGGGVAIVVGVLPTASQLVGALVAGWRGATPSPAVVERIASSCRLAAAALAHADLREDLRCADRTKSEFVATMSHELRSPLSAILGYTELLVNGDFGALSQEQGEVVGRAHRSASTLLELINATLDVSRFEVGDRRLAGANLDLLELITEQIAEAIAAHRLDEVIIADCSAERELQVFADPLQLRVALRQVLEAAILGNPETRLEVCARSAGGGFDVEVVPARAAVAGQVPEIIELPEDGDVPWAPVSLLVARRLIEILGGSLAAVHYEGGGRGLRIWLPSRGPESSA